MKEKCSKRQGSAGLFERMCKGLDIDADMLCRGFFVTLRGKNHAEICGVRRILVYTDERLSFVTADGMFDVSGRRLCCAAYKSGAVIVEGEITQMGFVDGVKDGDC